MSDDEMISDNDAFDDEYDQEDDDPDNALENQYYHSEAICEDDPNAALQSFKNVLLSEKETNAKCIWGFKSLEQMVKIYLKKKNFSEMLACYQELLTYVQSAVTRNESEITIITLIDLISGTKIMDLIENLYNRTLATLIDVKSYRLWFKIYLKLAKLYEEQQDFVKLQKTIRELYKFCETSEGANNQNRGTDLLELYALEIQVHTVKKNNKRLKQLYEESLKIKSAIPHPLIMGVIRECGGKMHLREQEYEKAHIDFFEAFKNYDEPGSPRRITCLKYLVLSNMLMRSTINPFDSQEAKPYKDNPEIRAMTNLVIAYQNNNIKDFEHILNKNHQTIMDDQFIREHIELLLRTLRTQVLIKLIKPYTKIRIDFISKELNITNDEVENLLVSCILDHTITGKIDQVNHILELDQQDNIRDMYRYEAISNLAEQLRVIQQSTAQHFR